MSKLIVEYNEKELRMNKMVQSAFKIVSELYESHDSYIMRYKMSMLAMAQNDTERVLVLLLGTMTKSCDYKDLNPIINVEFLKKRGISSEMAEAVQKIDWFLDGENMGLTHIAAHNAVVYSIIYNSYIYHGIDIQLSMLEKLRKNILSNSRKDYNDENSYFEQSISSVKHTCIFKPIYGGGYHDINFEKYIIWDKNIGKDALYNKITKPDYIMDIHDKTKLKQYKDNKEDYLSYLKFSIHATLSTHYDPTIQPYLFIQIPAYAAELFHEFGRKDLGIIKIRKYKVGSLHDETRISMMDVFIFDPEVANKPKIQVSADYYKRSPLMSLLRDMVGDYMGFIMEKSVIFRGKTKVHPETGELLFRGTRKQKVSFNGNSVEVNMPGWYPKDKEETDGIHSKEDMKVSDEALAKLKEKDDVNE